MNNPLPITETRTPAEQVEVAEVVREYAASAKAIYTIGGGTALDYGLPAKTPGIELATTGMARVIDYPARDMTVTVEAGIRMAELQRLLAGERQRLPVDAPQAEQATLGGVIATNTSGPRRFAQGTMRDYVIGISAIDGQGTAFKAGGRVVKNVAGYDFCKLLTGSMGTLAVITQVTLKVKPMPEASAFVVAPVHDLEQAESLLASMVNARTAPVAIELLVGPAWRGDSALGDLPPTALGYLVAGLEGTEPEVRWMVPQLIEEWRAAGADDGAAIEPREVSAAEVAGLWERLIEFPAAELKALGEAALVLKLAVPPSQVTAICRKLLEIDPQGSIQAHAGNGVVIARFGSFPAGGMSKVVIASLQPAAQRAGGSCVVLRTTLGGELTHQATWGRLGDSAMLMDEVKRQFDPQGLLNPGRFVYSN